MVIGKYMGLKKVLDIQFPPHTQLNASPLQRPIG